MSTDPITAAQNIGHIAREMANSLMGEDVQLPDLDLSPEQQITKEELPALAMAARFIVARRFERAMGYLKKLDGYDVDHEETA